MAYIIPLLFLLILGVGVVKRTPLFDSFEKGVKDAVEFTLSLLPCLASVFMMCELFEVSGASLWLTEKLTPLFHFVGIPPELARLMLIKPFSGSGSLAYLTDVLEKFGADSYIGRCACVLYGSSETVFYLSAVYFAHLKKKKLGGCILIVLTATFVSSVVACLLCRVM